MSKLTLTFIILVFACRINGYSQWVLDYQFLPYPTYMNSVSVVDTNILWVSGYDTSGSLICRKTLSGWVRINTDSLPGVGTVIAKDSMRAFINTWGQKLYYTSNAGQNWILKLSLDSMFYIRYGFSKTNTDYGFALPNSMDSVFVSFYRSSDGGMTWTSQYIQMEENYYPLDFAVTDPNHIYIGTFCYQSCNDVKYLYTSNGGLNWHFKSFTPMGNEIGMSAPSMKLDNLFGFATYESWYTYIYKTTNGGINWSIPQLFTTGEGAISIVNIDSSSIWFCRTLYNVLKTTNDGGNWFAMSVPPHDSDMVVDYQFLRRNNKIYGWAVTGYGRIFKLVEEIPIGINVISSEIPKSFVLHQNYPNPFNPVTKIKFEIPRSSNVKVTVYNVLGQLIKVLLDENRVPGSYSEEFDGANLPSGLYIYRIESGDFTESKKMLLVK